MFSISKLYENTRRRTLNVNMPHRIIWRSTISGKPAELACPAISTREYFCTVNVLNCTRLAMPYSSAAAVHTFWQIYTTRSGLPSLASATAPVVFVSGLAFPHEEGVGPTTSPDQGWRAGRSVLVEYIAQFSGRQFISQLQHLSLFTIQIVRPDSFAQPDIPQWHCHPPQPS